MKVVYYISLAFLIITALCAIPTGYSFMNDPSGNGLKIPFSKLQYSTFQNYFLPGLVLFSVIGILNMVVAVMTIIKHKNYPEMMFIQGVLLLTWIVIQVICLWELNFLQLIFGMAGIFLMIAGKRLQQMIA